MSVAQRNTIIKRIPTQVDYRDDISSYGADNLYPQRIEEISYRSPITTSCINTLATFLEGGGFIKNGDAIVNRHDKTLNDILREVTKDAAMFNGFALHINVDEIGGITEINNVKFKDARFGLPNRFGRHKDVKVNINWEEDFGKTTLNSRDVFTFPLWSKRNECKIENIEEFNGFILYWTPEQDIYPKCTFDSCLDSAQTNGEIQVFELGTLQNSFLGTTLFKQQGEIEDPDEETQLLRDLHDITGAENAGSVMVVNVPEGFDGSVLEQIPANNSDRLFELTNKTSVNRVISTFAIPKSVLGIEPEGGMFNQEEQETAHKAYNKRTRRQRETIAKVFDRLLVDWHTGSIQVDGISEQDFETLSDNEITEEEETTTEEVKETVKETTEPEKVEKTVEEKIQKETSFNGAQIASALDIINRVSIGELSESQGISALMEFLRLTEETARELLTK